YLTSEGLDEGHYVVFSNRHRASDALTDAEVIHGKRIYTWIIPTDFKAPSRRGNTPRRRRKG
ncbi:MAG: hypothetical protein U0350_38220, partial [Caldilineaceae bacterium]